jgi:hypothetical protein
MVGKMDKRNPVFAVHYDINSIEYCFKFWDTDERTMHKAIISLLTERLKNLRLVSEAIIAEGTGDNG